MGLYTNCSKEGTNMASDRLSWRLQVVCMFVVVLAGLVSLIPLVFADTPPAVPDNKADSSPTGNTSITLDIKVLMQHADYEKCGLGKLTPEETANLNRWLTEFAAKVIDYSSKVAISKENPPTDNISKSLQEYLGCRIIASDGKFLGVISKDKYDAKSLANRYGDFGSKYNTDSILNKYGDYGSKYSDKSPFNEYSTKPPTIFKSGEPIAFLTMNKWMSPRVDPNILLGWLEIER